MLNQQCNGIHVSEDCIVEEEAEEDILPESSDGLKHEPCTMTPVIRKPLVGIKRSHTWTASDIPGERPFLRWRKTDSLRQGLLIRNQRRSLSLQNVFCLVKETSINSVKTLIKLFEMNQVRPITSINIRYTFAGKCRPVQLGHKKLAKRNKETKKQTSTHTDRQQPVLTG